MPDANGFANEGPVRPMKRIRATLATTDYVLSYGGIRLSLPALESMLQGLTAGTAQTRLFHDSRRPLRVENVEAGIEQRPDGEYALWVEFDADEDRWAEYEAERDARGGPGGLSFTLTETFDDLQARGEPTSVSIVVAADAGHFSDQQIRAAADALTGTGSVKASRLYQFAAEPTALALIQFLVQEGAQIPPGVFSAWLYDALRRLHPGRETPAVDLQLIEDGTGRRVLGHIPAQTDPEVAKRAIEAWESVSNREGTYEWTPDQGWQSVHHRETE
jgi:hypothetical protein